MILNTAVFPGSGYFVLGRKTEGIIISGLVVIFLCVALAGYTKAFNKALEHLQLGVPLLPQIISATGEAWQLSSRKIIISITGIIILWIYGIVDLVRFKKR